MATCPPALRSSPKDNCSGLEFAFQSQLRIRRVSLREENGSPLLWKETFTNPDRKLRLEGPPDSRYSLLAADNDGLRLYYPGAFDACGR